MNPHLFLFQKGIWIGEGKVAFSASKDHVKFFTRWNLLKSSEDTLSILQEVELHGLEQTTLNKFTFSEITHATFKVELENELMGKVSGKGVLDSKTIAWELRDHPGLEGFEVYELQENGDYLFHAEYASNDQFRTLIEGKVWKRE